MKYKVNEIFESYQGEGFNQGKKVVFIRLSGCNLKCNFCDTNHESFTEIETKEIFNIVNTYRNNSIIITGGEPTIHNLLPLLKIFKKAKYWIGIESNGTNSFKNLKKYIDYITVSPKINFISQKVNELRVVNNNLTAEYLISLTKKIKAKHYFISPLDFKNKMNIFETLQLLGKTNEISKVKWQISLQLHKLINIK